MMYWRVLLQDILFDSSTHSHSTEWRREWNAKGSPSTEQTLSAILLAGQPLRLGGSAIALA
eukprot:4223300-Amphidinium_carterae.1